MHRSPIPSGGASTFTLRFEPGIVGGSTATVRIATSDAGHSLYDFTVAGVGLAFVLTWMTSAFGSELIRSVILQ